ncbi:MAG: 16S rRNA (cytidine(1402)-2'-O)-methyltransferase [Deltaproteobacteria bacterium]|nr:MAG: 16S rRNA (cytidine(1402)-2'-O)-methyltransferase [Deltaproteobacteria bacterium]
MRQRDDKGVLYVVATPIGNLEDITLRAIKTLREVDLIAAEDTRRTRTLLSRYRIKAPTVSFFEGNEGRRTAELLNELRGGKRIALLCDAGTPTISDPGYRLVRGAREAGIPVVPIPGPTALIAALSASGLPTDSFSFFGFLPPKGAKRRRRLEEVARSRGTVILYESPRRLIKTLEDLLEYCGDRQVVIARELTKVHEEFVRGSIRKLIEELRGRTIRGEITIVMEGLGWR